MRLYRIDRRSKPGSRWVGTQAEAKQLSREEGAPWDTVEVKRQREAATATDRQAMIDRIFD